MCTETSLDYLSPNTMALSPKIGEVAFTMKNHHCDIGAITEIWLMDQFPT